MSETYIRKAGEKAPELELLDPDSGQALGLADVLSEAPTLLYWVKSACPTCQLAMPFVGRIASRTEAGRLICVTQDEVADVPAIRERYGLEDARILCEEAPFASADRYGITHVPSWFLVGPDGEIQESGMMFVQEDLQRSFANLGGEGELFADEEKASVPPMRPG